MNYHSLWLWVWFAVGMGMYMLKRAYFLVTGPNPVAGNYSQFLERCWIPLLIRGALDSGIYWATFTPQVLAGGLNLLGWSQFASAVNTVTQYGFFALFFGFGVDSVLDFAVTKIPWIKDMLPQMPGPLPQPAVVQAAIVETKVTALETKTTVVPK